MRWSTRSGHWLAWLYYPDVSAAMHDQPTVADLWEMKDGDFITITNRVEDLPQGLKLHYTEVAGALAFRMSRRPQDLSAGVIDAPNLWRARSGHRLAWLDETNETEPIRELLTFKECALVVAETVREIGLGEYVGDLTSETPSPKTKRVLQAAVSAATELEPPRSISLGWRIG